jgi:hypothetical protein
MLENSASEIGRREDEPGPRAVSDGRPTPRSRSRSFGAMVVMGTAGHLCGGIAGEWWDGMQITKPSAPSWQRPERMSRTPSTDGCAGSRSSPGRRRSGCS